MQYLDYIRYKEIGGALDQMTFNKYYIKAVNKIDTFTDYRIKENTATAPTNIDFLAAELIDHLFSSELKMAENISSVSNDGFSESYKAPDNSQFNKTSNSIITSYLLGQYDDDGVELIYKGLR